MQDLLDKINLDTKQIIGIAGFIIIIISVPLSFTLLKKSQTFKSQASTASEQQQYSLEEILKKGITGEKSKEVPKTSLEQLKKLIEATSSATPTPKSSSTSTTTPTPTPDISLSFGPILSFKTALEGRAADKQAAKVFVGIGSGSATKKPTYLLTYTIDIPDSGSFRGLSLAGLTPGSTYTAYIKGPSHIDTASTFSMSPTETTLNSNQAASLTAGDLNEDNVVDNSDYNLARTAYGSSKGSLNWNAKADINNDGAINNFDLSYISKNLGKIGASGSWYSSSPKVATASSALTTTPSVGGVDEPIKADKGGYWLWVPPVENPTEISD